MDRALFFNALPDEESSTGYDRNYNADDLSDFLSIVCDTGVVKTNTVNTEPQGLKVVAANGMTINVNAGKAAIKGKGYIKDALESFTVAANGTASNRYDYVVIKYDNNVSARDIRVELRTGTSSIPTVSNLTRNAKVHELMLAYITVAPSDTSITQAEITDTRGDTELCPWFTAAKGYDDYYDAAMQTYEDTITYSTNPVVTGLPSSLYNERYSLVEVYTNGLKELNSAYTASVSGGYIVITFTSAKAAGAKITVILNNFIDGEGMTKALAQYTQLVQDVTDLKAAGEYNYICNGVNDNILIGNIVRAYLQAETSGDYGTMKLNVIGTLGMTTAAYGTGTTTNPYGWFNLNIGSDRRAIVDFSRCSHIAPPIADGTYNHIFHSNNGIEIIGATVIASNTATDTVIRIIGTTSGVVKFENCRFYITAYKDGLIAHRGTFTNCRGSVANVTENSYCFLPASNGVVKIIGGEYYAYTADANKQSAIVGQSGADAVSILYGVSAPTSARSGYYQTNSILQFTGGGIVCCTDLISALPMSVVSGISNIRGTIAKSKINVW